MNDIPKPIPTASVLSVAPASPAATSAASAASAADPLADTLADTLLGNRPPQLLDEDEVMQRLFDLVRDIQYTLMRHEEDGYRLVKGCELGECISDLADELPALTREAEYWRVDMANAADPPVLTFGRRIFGAERLEGYPGDDGDACLVSGLQEAFHIGGVYLDAESAILEDHNIFRPGAIPGACSVDLKDQPNVVYQRLPDAVRHLLQAAAVVGDSVLGAQLAAQEKQRRFALLGWWSEDQLRCLAAQTPDPDDDDPELGELQAEAARLLAAIEPYKAATVSEIEPEPEPEIVGAGR